MEYINRLRKDAPMAQKEGKSLLQETKEMAIKELNRKFIGEFFTGANLKDMKN